MFWNGQVKVLTSIQPSGSCEETHQRPRAEAFLYRGMEQNSSKPMCITNQQLPETFSSSYYCTGVTPDTESKGSHTFATHRYVILDHLPQLINNQVQYFCLICLIGFS